ncbi:hypothetical protein GCM10010251_50130 [Streptomyces aurantiogriseus]|uniref:Uncharacterized protein n=1 Tax=Streptomyces aurantiogriseus TaxID=66870 RepID=A0A918CJX9_9ACTN|nr:hypothetical protein GCM10010251_50130 [Streptomyces aurantiogriseus]
MWPGEQPPAGGPNPRPDPYVQPGFHQPDPYAQQPAAPWNAPTVTAPAPGGGGGCASDDDKDGANENTVRLQDAGRRSGVLIVLRRQGGRRGGPGHHDPENHGHRAGVPARRVLIRYVSDKGW